MPATQRRVAVETQISFKHHQLGPARETTPGRQSLTETIGFHTIE